MNLQQKIIKRGEDKNYSNSQLQNTSATDNYHKDDYYDQDDGDQYQDQEYYQNNNNNNVNNDSYQYDENKLGEIFNDSEGDDDTQNTSTKQYQQTNQQQGYQSNQQKQYNQQQSISQQKQYHNHVIKSNPQISNNKQSKQYDLSDSDEDDHYLGNNNPNNNSNSNNNNLMKNVHYSELEKEIYGITKQQEELERKQWDYQRRKEEEAKQQHKQKLENSTKQNKKKDSRDYNSSPECLQSCSSYFPLNQKVQNEMRMPLAISIAPFYEPQCLEIINFKCKKNQMYTTPYLNEEDIPRCLSCQTVINPFCEILESLCKWKCNMCFNIQSAPRVYKDSIFNIRSVRPELQYGSYDILLPNKYRVRRDSELVYWFMIDVSRESVETGFLRNTIEGIRNALQSKNIQCHKNNIKIGFVGYDDELHIFNISSRLRQPQLFVFKELEEQMDQINQDTVYHMNEQVQDSANDDKDDIGFFAKLAQKIQFNKQQEKHAKEPKFQQLDYEYPFPDDIVNNFEECEKNIFTLLDQLEIMYEDKYKREDEFNNNNNDKQTQNNNNKKKKNIFYKAMEFSLDHIKFTGGRLFIFHSSPEIEQVENKNYTIFSIQNKMEDTFIVPFIFYQQNSLQRDLISFVYKLIKECNGYIDDISKNDIISNKYKTELTEQISKKQSWESVLRFRCSQGWTVSSVQGNTQIRTNTYNLLNLNCDSSTHITIEVQNEILQNKINFFCFQSSLVYTNEDNQRVMRVHNHIIPLTNSHINIFSSINSKVLSSYYAKLYLQAIINRTGDNKQFESYIIQELRFLVKNQLQYNRAVLVRNVEQVILSVLGLFKQKCLLQRNFPQGLDTAFNEILFYQRMSPNELDVQFVPLIFDYDEVISNDVYDENGTYVFPKSLSLSYQSIFDKQIIIADLGSEFIILVLVENAQTQSLISLFNTDDLEQIKLKTKEEFYKNTSKESEKVMILLNSLSMLKTKQQIPLNIIITSQGDPREFEFYYKLIEDKYDSYSKGYHKSYDELVDQLLKQN